jgi:hypothetical protein
MKVATHVKTLFTAKTRCYVDTDLCTVTKQNSVNYTLLTTLFSAAVVWNTASPHFKKGTSAT